MLSSDIDCSCFILSLLAMRVYESSAADDHMTMLSVEIIRFQTAN